MIRRNWLPLAVLAALALAPVAGFASSYETTLMARIMILAMAAVSLSFLVGGAGLASLGHAAAVGVGAYAVVVLDAQGVTEAAIVLPVAIVAAALFSLLTGAIAIRTSGVHFIMITLAFGQMAFFTASSLSAYGGDDGYTLYSRTEVAGARLLENRLAFHYIVLGALALTWAVCAMLLASRFGRVLRAARENAQRVEAIGLAPYPFRLTAYVIAGAIAGVAGVLLANATEFVSPAILSWQRSGELLFMVILGGIGRLWGAMLGAVVFVLLETWLAEITPHWRMIFGPLLVIAVLTMRNGLSGLVHRRMAEPLLRLTGLRKHYGGLAVTDGVSLDVRPGEIHAVIGPNGAGKTTLIHEITGVVLPDSGRIDFAGRDITRLSLPRRARAGLARSFQITSIVAGFSALENVALAAQARDGSSFRFFRPAASERALNDAAMAALGEVGLGDRAAVPAGALSHGEKRALELAIALATQPRLLLLDEPLAGAGPEETERLVALLTRLKARYTILLVEHDMQAVFALADRISVLVYGRVIATGSVAEIRGNAEVRAAYLGEDDA